MQAILLRRTGAPRVLRLEEVPDPAPGAGELLVQVRAAGVNFADVAARQGLYPEAPRRPYVPGYESAGDVIALGPGVEGFRAGDRVLAYHLAGGYAQRVAVPAEQAVLLPDQVSFQSAVVLPVNYGTAFIALHRTGPVEQGMRIFIHAAAGGVGLAAVDLARLAGLEIVGAASTFYKRERLLAEGVKHVVPSRRVRVHRIARQLFGGKGFDIVLDSVGGPGIRSGLRALRPGGRLVTLGVSSMSGRGLPGALLFLLRAPRVPFLDLLRESRGLCGVNLRQLMGDRPLMRRILETLVLEAVGGGIRPEPGRVLPLEEAATAHELLESRTNVGKIVLRMT